MESKRYATAAAFRRALEDRLKDIAGKEGVDLQRLRRQVAFDRLLARLFQVGEPLALPWVLKGGYAMELRIKAARTTKDIDLAMRSVLKTGEKKDDKKNLAVLEKLQEAAAFKSDDFFVYTIGEPISDLDAAPYGGARFPVEARLDGRVFVGFHLDVGIGDAVIEPLEVMEGRDWLGFAGIASPSLYLVPREQQFAEKLHAYTLPRKGAANTRVRDLVDLVLLIQSGTLDKARLREAIRLTFDRRGTHAVPNILPHPPTDWQKPYDALAKECGLSGAIEGAFAILDTCLREVGIVETKLRNS
jgi:Nucleotidyl transferase AbiEii toxin, Type IV TA system